MFNDKKWYKIINFLKQTFIVLLNLGGSLARKRTSLNNQPCIARTTLIDENPDELPYHPFVISVNKCGGSCDTIDDP